MAYTYFSPITINTGQVPSTQTNFPVLFNTIDSRFKTVANGGHVKNASGFDIRPFTDSTLATPLSFDLERYNASTGEVVMWIKLSSVSNGTTYILAYGDSTINTDGSSTSTWSNNFKSVAHMADGTTLNLKDSVTGNNFTQSSNHVTAATGMIDGCGSFASASSEALTSADLQTYLGATVSAWINATSFPNSYNAVGGYDPGAFALIMVKSTGKLAMYTDKGNYDGTGSNTLSTGTWYYLVLTANQASGLVGYVNGSSDHTATQSGDTSPTTVSVIGNDPTNPNRFFNGLIDEFRMATGIRSADWITTEYNNQNAPSTFYTLGTEAPLFGVGPISIIAWDH